MMDGLTWFAVAAVVASSVALLTRQLGWGMALPVLAAGVVVDLVPFGIDAPTNPEIVLVAILAPLVFGEALGSSYLDLRKVSRPILALAIGLVLATTLTVGGVAILIVGMPIAIALALGAILAPTDAVAVSAVARRASLPRRLISILEGESLVNDGTGLTLVRVAVIAAVAGTVSIGEIGVTFGLSVIGGVGIGLLGGWVLAWVLNHSTDSTAANGLVIIAPFALFLLAEAVEGSGILAVVVAALWIANSQISDPNHQSRMHTTTVWRQITFLLQAIAFFIVGMELSATIRELPAHQLLLVAGLIAAVVVTLILTRFVFVLVMVLFASVRQHRRPPTTEVMRGATIVSWAGSRGPVSGMAAFSLPFVMLDGAPLPYRDVVLATTFGVILVTLLISQTLAPLARALKIPPDDDSATVRRVRATLAHAAMQQLNEAEELSERSGEPLPPGIVAHLRQQCEARVDHHGAADEASETREQQFRTAVDLHRAMIRAEKAELLRIREDEGLPDAIVRPLLADLDARERGLSAD
jgi:monovalent cation/hydrogen antiporter